MSDIDNITRLYSNAMTRAERAEERLRQLSGKVQYLLDLMETHGIKPSDFGEDDEAEIIAVREWIASTDRAFTSTPSIHGELQ